MIRLIQNITISMYLYNKCLQFEYWLSVTIKCDVWRAVSNEGITINILCCSIDLHSEKGNMGVRISGRIQINFKGELFKRLYSFLSDLLVFR